MADATSLGGAVPQPSALDLDALAARLRPLANARRLRILQLLTRPHYLEELAEAVGTTRQAVLKHLALLLELGVVQKQAGKRHFGPVVEYVLVPPRLFALSEEFAKLGTLEPEGKTASPERARTRKASLRPKPVGGASAQPALLLVHGRGAGRAFPLLGDGPWAIGRDPEREVCLDYDPFVSSRHAEVRRAGGGFGLVDSYATNGTTLNWERVPRGGEVELRPGHVVGVGRSILVFQMG